jgi:hypothetical protein
MKLNVVHLQQSVMGIKVREEFGHFLLIDGNDSSEMFLMSSLFKHVNDTNEVVFLQRGTQSNADLIIFSINLMAVSIEDMNKDDDPAYGLVISEDVVG